MSSFRVLSSGSPSPRLEKMASFAKGKILDIGFSRLPNPYLDGEVIGIDIRPTPRPPTYRAVFIGDITDICFPPASFDTVVAGELIEHLENPIQFLRDSRCLLRKGGTLILSTPNPYYPPIILLNWFMIRKYYYARNHIFEIAPRYLVRFLEQAGFRLKRMLSGDMIIPLGQKRILTVPVPRAICYHMIYVAEAV